MTREHNRGLIKRVTGLVPVLLLLLVPALLAACGGEGTPTPGTGGTGGQVSPSGTTTSSVPGAAPTSSGLTGVGTATVEGTASTGENPSAAGTMPAGETPTTGGGLMGETPTTSTGLATGTSTTGGLAGETPTTSGGIMTETPATSGGLVSGTPTIGEGLAGETPTTSAGLMSGTPTTSSSIAGETPTTGAGLMSGTPTATGGAASVQLLPITMNSVNASGQSGLATLVDMGNGTIDVSIYLPGTMNGTPEPAHIHKGTCANLDPNPAFPLNDVTNGESHTVVATTLSTLTQSQYAINVHKSASEINTYVACGDIMASGTQTPGTSNTTTGTSSGTSTPGTMESGTPTTSP